MDFSVRIMLALLLISLQLTGGDFHKTDKKAKTKIPKWLRRRFPSKSDKTKQENDKVVIQTATDLNSNLEWVASTKVPKDTVSFIEEQKEYYIAKRHPKCEICFFDKDKQSCITWLQDGIKSSSVGYNEIMFLVNKDNFEIIEWKLSTNQTIPPMVIEVCEEIGVFQDYDINMENITETAEFLTLNTDFKMQHLSVVEYLMSSVVTSENLEVLKHFQASNENCKPSKHTVKFDQNIDKTTTYQTGKINTLGGNVELSVSGKIPSMISIGGKFGLKYDRSHSRSNTTSVVEKTLHSVDIEVEIPPNHSCTIDITSNTFIAEVPFTGEMTRMYKNNEIRKTFINGTYIHQEVAEIQTLVNPCQPLSESRKCQTKHT
ncbi:natterin-3-like [Labeo rohita]|uniref:natterin-3-like n=1 Tax=Labeo rohita TaxID=84645 RepID=UPI0021E2E474|nr:natterin-3-like [Labeo rohita]